MKSGGQASRPLERAAVRLVLLLYPPRLRRKHGAEMEILLLARLHRARNNERRWTRAGVWWGVAKDLSSTVVSEVTARSRIPREERRRRAGVSAVMQDLGYALRRLARTPVFTLGGLAIMALAIGANTAVFTVVNKALLVPPPFGDPERVVNIYQDSDDGEPSSSSFPAYRDMAALHGVFASVGATSPDAAEMEVDGVRWPVAVEFTTSDFMEVIGRSPSRGRWFDPGMDQVGAGNYAVVSHYAWENRFGSDPDIVGRTLRLNGEPVTVIGVGPEDYNGIGGFVVSDLWLSISTVGINGDFRVANLNRREDHWFDIRARLAEGVTVAQAQEAMDALARRLAESFPEMNEGRGITVFRAKDIRLHPEVDGSLYSIAGLLMVLMILVLVLASSNLGGLLLVRGASRTSEVAVRRAMGAPPSRVVRLFLSEALVISLAGGALGVLLAHWLLGLTQTLSLPGPLSGELDLAMDFRVLLFSLALMLGTGIFFGWAPAMQSNAADLSGALREDRRTASGSRHLSLFRNLMVSVQVAVSLVLVVGAGVMVRSLRNYYHVDTGVDVERLAFLQTDFTQAGIPAEERGALLDELLRRMRALPGVEDAALTSRLPVQGGGTTTTVIEDYEPPAGTGSVELSWAVVTPRYFETMGMEILEGRGYLPADRRSDEPIIVVNRALTRFWGGETALGRRIRPQSVPEGWRSVVGVVADTKVRSLSEPPTPMLYYVMGESGVNAPYLVIRTSGDPAHILSAARGELMAVSPRLTATRLSTMEAHVGETIVAPKVSAAALGLFSLLALLLASVGIYTIVSFSVAGRMPEIGIRVALGAPGSRVVLMVVGEVAATVILGLVVGAVLVALISPRVQGFLYGAEALSFGTLLPALAVLGATVALASYLPARRAAAADPVEALRAQ
ncbi:MAG: ABC transporter permease [Gemmatimonadota bacterium]